jgi:hypothetical protein
VATNIVLLTKELTLGPHDWLLGVFREISEYARLNNLPNTFDAVAQVQATLDAEFKTKQRSANNVLAFRAERHRM